VDHARRHDHHALRARRARHGHGVEQILRAVGKRRRRGPHGTGQHHGLVRCQHLVQKPRSFFERVRAVRNHHTAHQRVSQQLGAAQRQAAPGLQVHVLAVELSDLLRLQRAARRLSQARHRGQQLRDAPLRRAIVQAARTRLRHPCNGAARAQHDNFFRPHLRTPNNC